jgi:hypothetical protein
MAEWLKRGFKGEINASVRQAESQSRLVQVGASLGSPLTKSTATPQDDTASYNAISKNLATLSSASQAPSPTTEKAPVSLEPTVVLDEHSSYLNHLNQLRRINAGDELADRPGYGLYLVRIPVTLSPGPRSRKGKGAIITVSAKSVMTKSTLRNALRNTVINETVNNLTQAIGNQWIKDDDRTSGRGNGSFSLVSYADTELFYGRPNVELLSKEAEHQLSKDLDNEPHHRTARVSEWLRQELEASYQFLEQAATPNRSGTPSATTDPLEELGDLVARRDFSRIAQMQLDRKEASQVRLASSEAVDGEDKLGGRRKRVVSTLVFALQIQAAGISRRLKQDMTDQDPTVNIESLKGLSFFEPEVSNAAFDVFEHYVTVKWPLRVYAIEPVIAQQNVADAYGKSRRSAFDLFGAAPIGPWKALAGIAADSRAVGEEMAVRLNPTMVGFGAGQSTFGWVFYPRLQAGGNRSVPLFSDIAWLLIGGFPNPLGRDQSIEPGQRECTALIEMPNFVPMIEFVTVANWFGTTEIGEGQRSDLEKASKLGRRLVAAESALKQAKIKPDSQYRSEDYEIVMDRIKQLSDMMPTQRLVVRVPFSGDHNDSRIFCSQGLQLRPSLLGWHGKPPERGEESTLFVEGRNFSVHDTHVIAGGKPARAVLVSRNLLEVTIAKDASPTPSADGDPLLDINVATPNGVSNHLLIKMAPPDPHRKQPAEEKTVKPAKDCKPAK